ncbi:CheR family methyltransferase [Natranaerofaba carboxydovora]|uniref:CheR family methyltransferase n=1 Tax=Natranaerofaba carboxydovora TaxID=2742683 RepID=UPI001F13AC8E|nr:protein-glutamate O-methyltransferase CheR [Natranaerofaba carboxydovora]UMZ75058.1 Chemotaxis protein methyltransferase [Natranaerofaba carboxydovora]
MTSKENSYENADKSELSQEEFEFIRKMVYDNIGVNLTQSKKALVVSRLKKRLRELSFTSFKDYLNYLETAEGELDIVFNLITTNVTKFFREPRHFKFLYFNYFKYLEDLREEGSIDNTIRVWSAGCSTGEEPYTLAMFLHYYFKQNRKDWNIKILASDINLEVLKKARNGIYSKDEVMGVPYKLLKRYFHLGTGPNEGKFKVKDEIKSLVSFKRINLAGKEEYPIGDPFHIIFCRNVFIYFDKKTQNRILKNFDNHLIPGGILCLGHSESINVREPGNENWRLLEHTIYQKGH